MADFKTESQKFLSRSDWTLAARGGAYMKLRQNGIVSLMIRPGVFLAGGRAYMKLHLTNAEVGMWNAKGWSRCALSFF
ncbi:MAG: hypothetical protein WCB15_20065, partial [Desulfobacterales bacterium]